MEKVNPNFKIGDLVVVKSYPKELIDGKPLTGDPLHLPPIMCVIEVEIEDKNKKTHDNVTGKQIAERVKYKLIWFNNKKSEFVEKIMYESCLILYESKRENLPTYNYGDVIEFITTSLEISKEKQSITKTKRENLSIDEGDSERTKESEKTDVTSLMTYACPNLVMTGIKRNEIVEEFNDKGVLKRKVPSLLIKVMWFNYQHQKYSEYELPIECLTLESNNKK